NITDYEIPDELMHEMRSSIVFLGAIISRLKKARLSLPGGCELGPRPIDWHINALELLGVSVTEECGKLNFEATKGITGNKITLPFPSVGATENIMISSVMAKGETIIVNAAQEPEIVDLANYLISRGAKIKDAGKSTVIISGVEKLNDTEYNVIPDRIVAATYLCGCAITGGNIILHKVKPDDMQSIIPLLQQTGSQIDIYDDIISIKSSPIIKAIKCIRTMPYPGFPTDAQAPLMALLTLSNGTSIFVENIFENRYKHAGELCRMGADIKVEGKVCVVTGVKRLYASSVFATDLRGGAALCIAALAADGKTIIKDIHHIDRGYDSIEKALSSLGAKIKRES
ncbi:MAG: UDP-N-acetylglucosamine 1-carboxyvinyltransferase, partial [Oscillospiraceae bacterium]